MRDLGWAIVIVLIVVLTLAMASFSGFNDGWKAGSDKSIKIEREKAIEAGVGKWIIDEKTGKKEFRYGR